MFKVPFVIKLEVFAHLRAIFKVPFVIKDLLLDNLAGLLSTAFRLQSDRSRWGRLMCEWDHVLTWGTQGNPSCPMTSVAAAYLIFRMQTGETFDAFSNRLAPLTADSERMPRLHVATYRALLQADTDRVREELGQRFRSKGLDDVRIFANIKRMPSSMPAGHLLFMFRLLYNGLPTSRRMRFMSGQQEKACCFCGAQQGDSQYHWAACPKLLNICGRVYDLGSEQCIVSEAAVMLQRDADGHELHRLVRFWFATWKIRNVLMLGLRHQDDNDLLHHFLCVTDDPWLIGHPEARSRADRRRSRVRPPQAMQDWHVYNSDGASRLQPDESRKGSFGAELSINGAVVAKICAFIGDCTNNVAEYRGILEALKHARNISPPRVCFRVDSKLVCEQLCARWACRSPDLIPLYESSLTEIGELKAMLGVENVRIEHVYREFNVGADSLANVAIDSYNPTTHRNGIVVNENWSPHVSV